MEIDKSIAYEMAMLVKENRELRMKCEQMEGDNAALRRENDSLRETIREMKDAAKAKKVKPVRELFDAPYGDFKGKCVTITETSAELPKYPKGFVLKVKTISKNNEGITTIYGEYFEECYGDRRIVKTYITNKFYNWKLSSATCPSTRVEIGEDVEYIGLCEFDL